MTQRKKPTKRDLERKVRELRARIGAVRWLLKNGHSDINDMHMRRVLNLREKDWKILV